MVEPLVREEGTVVQVEAGQVIVAVVQTSACQSCAAKQGCGQAALSDWGDADRQAAKNHFAIPHDGPLRPGDRVTLGIEEDTVSLAAVWMYLWPLACAFLALLGAAALHFPEPAQLGAALAGGGLAFAATRRRFSRAGGRWIPRILETHPPVDDLIVRAG